MNLYLFLDEQECIWDSCSVLREDTSYSTATTKGQDFNPDIWMGIANLLLNEQSKWDLEELEEESCSKEAEWCSLLGNEEREYLGLFVSSNSSTDIWNAYRDRSHDACLPALGYMAGRTCWPLSVAGCSPCTTLIDWEEFPSASYLRCNLALKHHSESTKGHVLQRLHSSYLHLLSEKHFLPWLESSLLHRSSPKCGVSGCWWILLGQQRSRLRAWEHKVSEKTKCLRRIYCNGLNTGTCTSKGL